MANVNIKFNGKEYLLSCEDGQEEHLEELSLSLNKKFNDLKFDLGNIGENKLLLISSIKVMDEYFETKKKIDAQKKELQELKEKFKELKSLVYQYKDNKENEIKNLSSTQEELENDIENYKISYEKLIDKVTLEIEDFVKKIAQILLFHKISVSKFKLRKKIINLRKKKYFKIKIGNNIIDSFQNKMNLSKNKIIGGYFQ